MALTPLKKPTGRRKAQPGEEYLTTREGSPFWWLDFTIDGRRFRESCETKEFSDAAALAHRRHREAWREVKLGEVPLVPMTLKEACRRYYDECAAGTSYGEGGQRHQMARMQRILGPTFLLERLTDGAVAKLVTGLRTGQGASEGQEGRAEAANATVNRYLSTLQVVCDRARTVWNARVGTWTKAQHTMDEPEGRERFLTMAQAQDVVANIVPHGQPAVMLDLLTGLRKSNLLGLDWVREVNLDDGRLNLVQKGERSLTVQLVPQAVTLLQRLQPDPLQRRGAVFFYGNPHVPCRCSQCLNPARRGEQFSDLKRSIKTAFRRAGLPPETRFHDLRHTFASWLVSSSGNLRLTKEALGHASIKTTMRYAALMPGEKQRAIAAATAGFLPAQP